MRPSLSVLLPVREWRDTTAEAVQSVLDQSFKDFELLLIGHADIDDIVERLPADSRIKSVVRNKPGIVSALNTGLDFARGEFIARMDDDDVSHPERFAKQLDFLQTNTDVGLCGNRVRFCDQSGLDDGVGAGNKRYEKWLNSVVTPAAIAAACFIECPLPHPSWMAPRATFDLLEGYRDFDGPEDYDFVLRAWLAGVGMGKPDDVLLDWRVHDSRLTYRDARYRREAFTRCRARTVSDARSGLGLEIGREIWICGTGRNARYWFDALLEEQCQVSGFVDLDRSNARQRKRHRPVITYEELWRDRQDELVITAITDPVARERLQVEFDARGWVVNQDFVIGG